MTPNRDTTAPAAMPPLARAVVDSLPEGVLVFDADGRFLYANEPARRAVGLGDSAPQAESSLRARLVALGARTAPLRSGNAGLGEAVFIPSGENARTLAERERQAILDTLRTVNGKLAETARRLGISRTTLWRRLKTYGIERHAAPASRV